MYSYNAKVRYSEVNRQGKLSIPSVVNFMQDCSTFQSEHLGIGLEYLMEHKKAWVLNSWQIEFLEEIDVCQDIRVGTWAYDAKGIYGYRNFVIRTPEDRPLVNANSLWVYVNTDTGRPIKVTPEDVAPYGKEPKIDMDYMDRKIKIIGEGKSETPFSVRKYHIDTNGHVNNSWYIQFAMEYIPDDNMIHGSKINCLRVEYKKSAMYGDEIHPVIYTGERDITVALNGNEGDTFAIVQLIAK